MVNTGIAKGFSLVEILVSLFVVSIAAVNISGLQKMVGDQNRDNFIYSTVLKLATEKMEEVLQYEEVAKLEALPNLAPLKITEKLTDFILNWHVAAPDSVYAAGANVRDVKLQIDWNDSKGKPRVFTYKEQVNLALLLNPNGGAAAAEAAIVESFLETNEVIYFEAKMGYKKGAFVIYNSELFEATAVHQVGNGHPRDVDNPVAVADGWKSYGSIDNPELANNPDLATFFLDL